MDEGRESYEAFFRAAFSNEPFDYQRRLATSETLYSLVDVPTGAGKTAAILGAWLWSRRHNRTSIGRRLVYCLPMRTLVEQTAKVARTAIAQLTAQSLLDKDRFDADQSIYVFMGGDVSDDWDAYPERECILIGTQDMLLSRALNRGYAMSRFRWPVHFGLLNNDCLWVFDEIQLMGDGLATSAQQAAFREQFKTFGPSHSIWMSATLDRNWLKTVDFAPRVAELTALKLSKVDRAAPIFAKRLHAPKKIERAPASCRTPERLAEFVKGQHMPGTQTLVVVNRVTRACETFAALEKQYGQTPAKAKRTTSAPQPNPAVPDLQLMHSRFRPQQRAEWVQMLDDGPGANGRIIVATQVIEAGVNISSRILVTDLAPYANLVQRFGRCNRTGEDADAHIFWIDLPLTEKERKKLEEDEIAEKKDAQEEQAEKQLQSETAQPLKEQEKRAEERAKRREERQKRALKRAADAALPYRLEETSKALTLLAELTSAAPADLPLHHDQFTHAHVLRRRDLIDLFDTTPDLSGYDLDISRFVRNSDESDVLVAWRELKESKPPSNTRRPAHNELCQVPIGEFKKFLEGKNQAGKRRKAWIWGALEGEWREAKVAELRPGMTLLLDTRAGGYDQKRGWGPEYKHPVQPAEEVQQLSESEEGQGDDPRTFPLHYRQSLSAHSHEAKAAVKGIIQSLHDLKLDEYQDDLIIATHRHDWGKVHPIFQTTLHKGLSDIPLTVVLAKSTNGSKHTRSYFRHELASALALLQTGASDLTVYLAACHHGKVRLSIRAMSGEDRPDAPDKKFARGIWDRDVLPPTDLGDGVTTDEAILDLEPMLLGASANGARSWLERMITLRDSDGLGIFRLAFLEALIRAADVRASSDPQVVI